MNETRDRRADIAEGARTLLLGTAAAAVALGVIGAIIAWATGRSVSTTIAAAYYLIGSIVFLIGTIPTGGFSLTRGTWTQRRPLGSRPEPVFLAGLILIGLGVVVDFTRPF
jgi:hypothetical protein